MVGHQPTASAPTIDAEETRWAAESVASLLRQVGSDSPAGFVLRQAEKELQSLIRSAVEKPEVVGPFRVRFAA